MARVPRYTPSGVTTQTNKANIEVKTTPENFGGGTAKSMSAVAEQFAKASDAADEARVLKAKNELLGLSNNFMNDAENGVLNARGENAFGIEQRYEEEFKPEAEKIKEGMTDRQRALFSEYESKVTSRMGTNMQKHIAGETYKVEEENTRAYLENEQNAAVYNFSNPQEIEESIQRQKDEIKSMAERNGLSLESASNRFLKEESRTRGIVVEQLVNSSNSKTAKEYLKKHKKKFLSDDYMRLEKLVETGSKIQEAQEAADEILSKGMSTEDAIKEANRMFKGNAEVRDEVKSRIFAHEDEMNKAERIEREDNYNMAVNTVENNIGVPPQDIIPKTEWQSFKLSERQALQKLSRLGTSRQTDMGKYYDLLRIASNPSTRERFKDMNLMEAKPDLSESDFKYFAKMQVDLRKGNTEMLDGIQTKSQIVNTALYKSGLTKFSGSNASEDSVKKADRFRQLVDQEVVAWKRANGKDDITNEQLRKITEDLISEVASDTYMFGSFNPANWFLDSEVPAYQIGVDEIPPQALQEYRRRLKKRGVEPSEKNIMLLHNSLGTGE